MSWQQILGHDLVHSQFVSAWRAERVGHAYLFVGNPGIGKRLFAQELAKTLLCDHPHESLSPCGQCPSCHLFDAKSHPDYLFAEKPESGNQFTVEQVRSIIDQFGLKPLRNGRKIAVLDDVETMKKEAPNAFLKTLEEPPPNSVLILICHKDADLLLPTIRSRCQIIRFNPLPNEDVREILSRSGISDPMLRDRLAKLSGGSPGLALDLNEPDLWEFRNVLLGLFKNSAINSFEFSQSMMRFVEEAGKESGKRRRRAALSMKIFTNLLQDAVRVQHGVPPLLADANLSAELKEFAERVGIDKMESWTERALAAQEQIERYVQLELIIEAFADFIGR